MLVLQLSQKKEVKSKGKKEIKLEEQKEKRDKSLRLETKEEPKQKIILNAVDDCDILCQYILLTHL